MKAYQLTESEKQGAAIIFGRFNPPHFGHSNAWSIASQFPIWYVGTNQSTQGPKDPLPFEVKVEVMKTIMPEIEEHLVAEQSWWTLATMVYKQHGGDMVLHVVTDSTDKEIFVPQLQKYNGLEGPHGFYQFQDIVWEPARRDSTATALRAAVAQDDPQAFSKAAGVDANTMIAGKPFFELVKHYMTPHLNASAEKERLKAEKAKIKADKEAAKAAKVKGPAQELAEAQGKGPCWKNYKQIGMKKKGGKQVPNCVPKESVDSVRPVTPNGRQRISEELEAVYENRTGNIRADAAMALPSTYIIPKLANQDAYKQYRFGIALANARSIKAKKEENLPSFEAASLWGENAVVVGYTDVEEVLDIALAEVGLSASDKQLITTKNSLESNVVSTVSPVAKIKRNKYGV